MANFRFNNEQGQDDTGRVATYRQRIIDLTQPIVTINPLLYVNTYLLGGTQTQTSVTLNISANNRPNIGDYLELIIAPNADDLTLDFGTGFTNASQIVLDAGGRQIVNFQYDGTTWVNVLAASGGGGGGAVNTVNNIAPVNGNVNLGTIGTVTTVNNVTPVNGNVTIPAFKFKVCAFYIRFQDFGTGVTILEYRTILDDFGGLNFNSIQKISKGIYNIIANINYNPNPIKPYYILRTELLSYPAVEFLKFAPSGNDINLQFYAAGNVADPIFYEGWIELKVLI